MLTRTCTHTYTSYVYYVGGAPTMGTGGEVGVEVGNGGE